jgi:hypothetical protein
LPRKKGDGRPPVISVEEKSLILEPIIILPGIMGYLFTSWPLRKLVQAAVVKYHYNLVMGAVL